MCVCFFCRGKSKKVKWSRYRPGVAQRVGRGIALLFHDCGTRRGWVVSSTPRPHFTTGKDPVPILQEADGPQGQSGREENLVPTGIHSRTVQPIVSGYTDWSTGSMFLLRSGNNSGLVVFYIYIYMCVCVCVCVCVCMCIYIYVYIRICQSQGTSNKRLNKFVDVEESLDGIHLINTACTEGVLNRSLKNSI